MILEYLENNTVGEDLAINAANAGRKVAGILWSLTNKSAKHFFHLNFLLFHVDWSVRFRERGCSIVRCCVLENDFYEKGTVLKI